MDTRIALAKIITRDFACRSMICYFLNPFALSLFSYPPAATATESYINEIASRFLSYFRRALLFNSLFRDTRFNLSFFLMNSTISLDDSSRHLTSSLFNYFHGLFLIKRLIFNVQLPLLTYLYKFL